MAGIVVYTAILGSYDELRPPLVTGDARHVAFVDWPAEVDGWEVWQRPPHPEPRLAARFHKATPHRWLPDADYWIWLDGSIRLRVPPERLVEEWLADADIAGFAHSSRDCAYAEGRRCVQKGKVTRAAMDRQLAAYAKAGFPEHYGLMETGVVVRRNRPRIVGLGEDWWDHLQRYTRRDQVSLPFVCWQAAIDMHLIPGSVIHHEWMAFTPHRRR